MSEIKLIRAPGYQNTGSQRDYCYYRETILQELIPIVDVTDLVTFPPRKGAIGFDGVTGLLHYANGVAWLPVGTNTPVTLSSADTETLIAAASAYPNFLLKGLKAGTDIQLVPTATDLTINFTGVDGAAVNLTLDPFALGANLIDQGTGPNLVLKGIQGGTDISAVANGTDVVISYTGSSGSDVTLSLQPGAVGQNLITDGLGPNLALRGVAGGPHISVTSDATDVTVGFVGSTGDDVTLALAGGAVGQSIVNDGVGPALAVKGVAAGSNISVTSSPTDLTVAYTGTTASDVTLALTGGAVGQDLVDDGTGPSLSVKGVAAGANISVTSSPTDLTIAYTGTTASDVTLALAGGAVGQNIVNDGTGPSLAVKGVAAGANISVTSSPTDLTVAYTGTTGDDVTLALAGGAVGQSIVNDGVGPALAVKGVAAGSNISVTSNATDVTVAYTGSTGGDVTLTKVVGSTGEDWVVDGTGPTLSIKGFLSTNEVKVINGALDLTARQSYAYAETSVNTALTEADNHLGVHTAIAAVTVTLPLISTLSFFQKQFVVTDLDGNAPMNKITIQSTAPDTIQVMGGSPIVMNTKFGSIMLYSTNTGKWCLM